MNIDKIKNKIIRIFEFASILLFIFPHFMLPIIAATDETVPNNSFSNLASLSGAGICEENGLYSIYNEENTFEKSGTVQSIMYTGLSMLGGCYALLSEEEQKTTGMKYIITGGLLSSLGNGASVLYDTKTTSLAWQIEKTINDVNPNKTALAQQYQSGFLTGSGLLSLIAGIHKTVLNLVLGFYVIIFVIIAFAITFRQKLGGQEYVTIINSIPRVIISLILVIFSFPISGLIIDLGNVGYALVYNTFVYEVELDNSVNTPGNNNSLTNANGAQITRLKDQQLPANEFDFTNLLPTSGEMSVWRIFGFSGTTLLSDNLGSSFNIVKTSLVPNNVKANTITTLLTTIVNKINELAGTALQGNDNLGLVAIILTLGAVLSMFKLFFALLKEFIIMIFYPIFSPFQFAFYALPGQGKQIINYIKTLAGSVLSFVAVYAVFLLILFLGKGWLTGTSSYIGGLPLLGISGGASGIDISILSSLAAYGLFVISPSIPEMVKGIIGSSAGSFSKYTSQIGETTKAGIRKIPFVGGFV